MEEEKKDAISVIRGLVNTRKQMSTIRDVEREYREMVGEHVPYRKFGFSALVDFLQSSKQFNIKSVNGEVIITPKLSESDAHIRELVQTTKTKTKPPPRNRGLYVPPRRPHNATYNNNNYNSNYIKNNNNNNYNSNYNNNYNSNYNNNSNKNFNSNSNGINSNTKYNNYIKNGYGNGNSYNNSNNQGFKSIKSDSTTGPPKSTEPFKQPLKVPNLQKPLLQPKTKVPIVPPLPEQTLPKTVRPATPQVPKLKSTSVSVKSGPTATAKTVKPPPPADETVKPSIPPPKTVKPPPSAKTVKQPPSATAKTVTRTSPPETTVKAPAVKNVIPVKTPTPSSITKAAPVTVKRLKTDTIRGKPSVQGRLLVKLAEGDEKSQESGYDTTPHTSPTAVAPSSGLSIEPFEEFCVDTTEDPFVKLKEFVAKLKYPDVKYTFSAMKEIIRCKVIVNGMSYSSYPATCHTKVEALKEASRHALTQLYGEAQRKSYPVCSESDVEIAQLLHSLLIAYPAGIVDKVIPEYFQHKYGHSLPDHWTGIIGTYTDLFTCDNGGGSCFIVFALDPIRITPSSGGSVIAASFGPNQLELPWAEQYWNLYISCTATSNSVWALLIGEQYSNRMDSLMVSIEKAMESTDRTRASIVELHKIYLVTTSATWYRVRCQQIDFEKGQALCFLIDVGGQEWFPLDQMFVCEPKFQQLPAQCIEVTLQGLEVFVAQTYLEKMLAGKTVVAEVHSKSVEFETSRKVRAVLFDTSGEKDINLAAQLMSDICEATPSPQLERTGVAHVHVCHISDKGDIFCQVRNTGMKYIAKLFAEFDSAISVEGNKKKEAIIKQLDQAILVNAGADILFAARVEGQWYRARVVHRHRLRQTSFVMLCVDYGFQKLVSAENIFEIPATNVPLAKYPALAVKCRMFGIKEVNGSVISRMKGLLISDTATTLVKVMVPQDEQVMMPPLVNLYKRLEPNNIMCCINEAIIMEQELEGITIEE